MTKTFGNKLLAAWANRKRPMRYYLIELVGPGQQHQTWELFAPDQGFALAQVFYCLAEEHYPNDARPLRKVLAASDLVRVEQLPMPEHSNVGFRD